MGKLPFDSMRRRFITLKIRSKIEISIQEVLHDKLVPTTNNNNDFKFNHILLRFYKRNENDKFISTNEIKFKNPFFWKRVHVHLTNEQWYIMIDVNIKCINCSGKIMKLGNT